MGIVRSIVGLLVALAAAALPLLIIIRFIIIPIINFFSTRNIGLSERATKRRKRSFRLIVAVFAVWAWFSLAGQEVDGGLKALAYENGKLVDTVVKLKDSTPLEYIGATVRVAVTSVTAVARNAIKQ